VTHNYNFFNCANFFPSQQTNDGVAINDREPTVHSVCIYIYIYMYIYISKHWILKHQVQESQLIRTPRSHTDNTVDGFTVTECTVRTSETHQKLYTTTW